MDEPRAYRSEFGLKDSRPTESSDCYSLGMAIYETVSRNPPFYEHADMAVFVKLLKCEHPPRGMEFTESLWKVLEMCWTLQPNNRPSIEDVLRCLETVSISSESPPSRVSEEVGKGSGDWDESTKGSSGAPNGMSGTTMTENTTTYSDLSFVTVAPLRTVSTASVG